MMTEKDLLEEKQLTFLAKKYRLESGIRRAQAARDMGVKQTSIFHAEESPHLGYTKLRMRMIETYSKLEVVGPVFFLREKNS